MNHALDEAVFSLNSRKKIITDRHGDIFDSIKSVGFELEIYLTDAGKSIEEIERRTLFEDILGIYGWKIKEDATLDLSKGGVELTTPVIKNAKSLKAHLKQLIKFLNGTSFSFNKDTSLHVHIEFSKKINEVNLLNILNGIDQDKIFKHFNRVGNENAGPVKISNVINSIASAGSKITREYLIALQISHISQSKSFESFKNDDFIHNNYLTKYSSVNMRTDYNTYEFRHANIVGKNLKPADVSSTIFRWINYLAQTINENINRTSFQINDNTELQIQKNKLYVIKDGVAKPIETNKEVKSFKKSLDDFGSQGIKKDARTALIMLSTGMFVKASRVFKENNSYSYDELVMFAKKILTDPVLIKKAYVVRLDSHNIFTSVIRFFNTSTGIDILLAALNDLKLSEDTIAIAIAIIWNTAEMLRDGITPFHSKLLKLVALLHSPNAKLIFHGSINMLTAIKNERKTGLDRRGLIKLIYNLLITADD